MKDLKIMSMWSKNINTQAGFFLVLLAAILMQYGCTSSTNGDRISTYRLDFGDSASIKKWQGSEYNYCSEKIEKSPTAYGAHFLHVSTFNNDWFPKKLNFDVYQKIYLSPQKSNNAAINFTYRSKHLKEASLIVTKLNNKEEIQGIDTFQLQTSTPDESWYAETQPINIANTTVLLIRCMINGYDRDTTQYVDLNKFYLCVMDGKELSETAPPTIKLDTNTLVVLDDSVQLDKITELKTKKIIALGETIQQCETFNKKACDIIKHQVKENNCNLVLFELPTNILLSCNSYIQGDDNFNIDTLVENYSPWLFSPKALLDLFKWMRKFNDKMPDSEKIYIAGISPFDTWLNDQTLFEYLYLSNKTLHSPLLDRLGLMIHDRKYHKADSLFTRNAFNVKMMLGANDYTIIDNYLKQIISPLGDNINVLIVQDSCMADIANKMIGLQCKVHGSAVIYAHFWHTNKLTRLYSPESPAMGNLIYKQFGNEYFSLALLAGSGDISSFENYDPYHFQNTTLNSATTNSIEGQLYNLNKEIIYCPPSSIPQQLINIRYRENLTNYSLPYTLINPKERMDAALFLRTVHSTEERHMSKCDVHDQTNRMLLLNYDRYKEIKSKLAMHEVLNKY